MTTTALLTRLRIRTAADDGDLLVVTSEPGGTNPYLADAPVRADGQTLNPLTGKVSVGDYVIPVIDAVGTTVQEVVVWRVDFGIFADTSAFNSFWNVDDDAEDLATFAIDATHVYSAAKAVKVDTSGASASASGIHARRGYQVAGLVPGETYHVYRYIYDTGRFPSLPDNAWALYQDADVVASVSGTAIVYIGFITTASGVPDTDDHWEGEVFLTHDEAVDARIITGTLADVTGRLQYLGHRAYYEENADGGGWTVLVSGYVTEAELVDGLRWDIHVGDADRTEQTTTLFQEVDRTLAEPSCILGGPVVNGFANFPWGGWPVYEVVEVVSGVSVGLVYHTGPLPPSYTPPGTFSVDVALSVYVINGISQQFAIPTDVYTADGFKFMYPDLGVELYDDYVQVTEPGAVRDEAGVFTPLSYLPGRQAGKAGLIAPYGISVDWATNQPSVGDRFGVLMYSRRCTATAPFHLSGHPVDVAARIYTYLGIPYDTTSATATRNALGQNAWVDLRIPAPILAATLLQEALFGPFGFASRMGLDGEREFVATRYRPSSDPSTTLTEANLKGVPDAPWRVQEQSVCNRLIWTQHKYRAAAVPDGASGPDAFNGWPLDGIEQALYTVTIESTPDAVDTGRPMATTYTVPGQVGHVAQGGIAFDVEAYVEALAAHLFAQFGRGCAEQRLSCLRGVSAAPGDYVKVNIGHLPVARAGQTPAMQRGGTKVVQVVQRTADPAGPELMVWDVGPALADAPTPLVPVLTIEASATEPRKAALITVTNGAAITGSGFHVRIEYAVDDTSVSGWLLLGYVGAPYGYTVTTPFLNAGARVWARARLEKAVDHGPPLLGPYGDTVDVTLTGLTAPTDFDVTAKSDLVGIFTWTVGEADIPVVFEYATVGAATWVRYAKLPPGSNILIVPFADDDTTYATRIYHEEEEPWSGRSDVVTVGFDTVTTRPTLPAPTVPYVLIGGGGQYRLAVTATCTELINFEVAVEDAPGAGTFGSYVIYATATPSAIDETIIGTGTAPSDGCLRRLRAQHWASKGYTPSAYTSPVDVDPWATPPV